jgi:hypothetical protein
VGAVTSSDTCVRTARVSSYDCFRTRHLRCVLIMLKLVALLLLATALGQVRRHTCTHICMHHPPSVLLSTSRSGACSRGRTGHGCRLSPRRWCRTPPHPPLARSPAATCRPRPAFLPSSLPRPHWRRRSFPTTPPPRPRQRRMITQVGGVLQRLGFTSSVRPVRSPSDAYLRAEPSQRRPPTTRRLRAWRLRAPH